MTLLVMLQAAADERGALHDVVFLSAVDALAQLGQTSLVDEGGGVRHKVRFHPSSIRRK